MAHEFACTALSIAIGAQVPSEDGGREQANMTSTVGQWLVAASLLLSLSGFCSDPLLIDVLLHLPKTCSLQCKGAATNVMMFPYQLFCKARRAHGIDPIRPLVVPRLSFCLLGRAPTLGSTASSATGRETPRLAARPRSLQGAKGAGTLRELGRRSP